MQPRQIPFWANPPAPNRTAAGTSEANCCPQRQTSVRLAKDEVSRTRHRLRNGAGSHHGFWQTKQPRPLFFVKKDNLPNKQTNKQTNKQSNAPISKRRQGHFAWSRNSILPESQPAGLRPLAQSENLFCHRIAVVEAQVGRAAITRIDREREQRLIQVFSLSQEADAHTVHR